MVMDKYVIGVDFGTLSARALLVNAVTGEEKAVAECAYKRPLLTSDDLCGAEIEENAALQTPADYLEALKSTIQGVLSEADITAESVVGIGIDVTSSTVLPVDENAEPLCAMPEFKNEPQAYMKLWKHHSAQAEADLMTELAQSRNEEWLSLYGGKVSSEWFFPKLYEVLRKAPRVYEKMFRYVEAADWIAWKLTGNEVHSACMAGYKALWKNGYPDKSFWKSLDSAFSDVIGTKVSEKISATGSSAGVISGLGAKLTGLLPGTAVAVPIIDAHAALPAAGIVDDGKLMMIIGTSTCHIIMDKNELPISGICGSVVDGIAPGFSAYEAGQPCVGDCLGWFIENCVPNRYFEEAKGAGMSIYDLLNQKAAAIKPGENTVLALDWWNGNRSPLADFDLTGMLIGLTLNTRPEEIYRAIIEATAFGTKAIVELYERNGIVIREVYASGGIPRKNPFLMQIYADILGKDIKVAKSRQAGALGSAIFAAASAGCFDSLASAAAAIAEECNTVYQPVSENSREYEKLYSAYAELSEYFGRGSNVMKRLLHKE